MTPSTHYDLTIIGGGISGLALASFLKDSGKRIAIVEPNQPGGFVRSLKRDGFTLELGPNVFLEKPAISSLIDQLGLRSSVRYPRVEPYRQFVWYDGAAVQVPKSLKTFLFTNLLSPAEKLRAFVGSFRNRNIGVAQELTVDELFRFYLGSGVENLLDPALRGIFGGEIARLSASAIFPELYRALEEGSSLMGYIKGRAKQPKKRAFVLEGGNQVLVDAIVHEIEGRHGWLDIVKDRVCSLVRRGPHFEISLEKGSVIQSSEVCFATSGKASAPIIKAILPVLADKFEQIRTAPIGVVHVSVPKGSITLRDSFGILFPSSLNEPLMGVMFNSDLFPHVAPNGRDLLTVCFGGISQSQVREWGERDLIGATIYELRQKFEINEINVISTKLWPNAIPQYEIGHMSTLSLMQAATDEFLGLYFCGADHGGVGVPDRIERALELSKKLLHSEQQERDAQRASNGR